GSLWLRLLQLKISRPEGAVLENGARTSTNDNRGKCAPLNVARMLIAFLRLGCNLVRWSGHLSDAIMDRLENLKHNLFSDHDLSVPFNFNNVCVAMFLTISTRTGG